jgi:hypothetical protein
LGRVGSAAEKGNLRAGAGKSWAASIGALFAFVVREILAQSRKRSYATGRAHDRRAARSYGHLQSCDLISAITAS